MVIKGRKLLTIDQIIQLFVAIGTILVAILAIWGDWFRFKLGLRPGLVLSLHDPKGEFITIDESIDGLKIESTPTYYYHLKVSNKKRWTQAINVRVVITSLLTSTSDGHLVNQPLAGPLQLMWRHSQFHPPYSIVGPDDYCDLGFIKRGQNFKLTPVINPNNFPATLQPNKMRRLILKAEADNAESNNLIIDIHWDGMWVADQNLMASHLVVKKVNNP
jgi:hypothetical protein